MKQQTKKNKTPLKTACFGPILNPENYLNKEWWKQIFNSLYLKTDSDVVENEANTIDDVTYIIKETKITPEDKILDVCCGQGRHVLEFAKRGFKRLFGIDKSQYLIKLAKKRALFSGYFDVNFYEGDARKIKLSPNSLDLVTILGNSFGYFQHQEDDLTVLKEINKVLKPKGKLFIDIANGVWLEKNFQKRSWEWINKTLLVCRERTLAENKRLISREVVIHVNKGVIKDQFYAERLYAFHSIKELLLKADFENITLLDSIKSLSTRNQDLGMMENRLFIIAGKPQNTAQAAPSFNKTINCHVLLGDPALPDHVKNNEKFNAEDFDTVEKLKASLKELKDYNFTFIDNHEKISNYSIFFEKPDLVFNLCDEGYNNDPKKELHIPAFLEMLNIPYTGSNPACLANCYNKSLISSLAKFLKIKTPNETLIRGDTCLSNITDDYPVILKPALGDGSMGITQKALCHNKDELIAYYDWLKTAFPNMPVIVQEFLSGREFSVAILGHASNLEVLPVLEVDYTNLPENLPKLLGYESKWVPHSPYWKNITFKQAVLSENQRSELIHGSKMLFDLLQCKDYARFDFRADKEGNIKFLEVNPNPSWCWDGKLNLMAGFADLTYSRLLDKILKSAIQRYNLYS